MNPYLVHSKRSLSALMLKGDDNALSKFFFFFNLPWPLAQWLACGSFAYEEFGWEVDNRLKG